LLFEVQIVSFQSFMDYYVHNLDPFLVRFFGEVGIRWYGLAYVAGFVFAFLLLRRFSKQGSFAVPVEKVEGFVMGLALFGVLLGGRLGYCLLYGWRYWMQDPLYPFRLWEGGMASHGGMIGVLLYVFFYARKHQVAFWGLMDQLVCVVPLGLFFGRIANFINGELWGRVTDVPWAVIFPQSGDLQPRHPSQLYEAAGEGVLLFFVLWGVRKLWPQNRSGVLSCVFLLVYGAVRYGVEFFREPDSTIYWDWMSKGQLYSLVMIVCGLLGGGYVWWIGRLRRSS
jgi:phosphatidylglycerol:prolipoprotein diacylglycerol transferase